MEKLIREMKAATRSLLRTKGYGLTVIITLSACIAVNVAIFAIVNSVLLRPLPVPNAQQIVLMSNRYPKAGVPDQYISSSGDYYDRLKYVTGQSFREGGRRNRERAKGHSQLWLVARTLCGRSQRFGARLAAERTPLQHRRGHASQFCFYRSGSSPLDTGGVHRRREDSPPQ